MWFWFSIAALLCWSGSDLFSKIGCADARDKYSHFKMVTAVGVVMGLHAFYEIFVSGVDFNLNAMLKYLPVLIYSFIPASFIYLLHKNVPFSDVSGQYRVRIPVYVPEDYKVYLIVSLLINILFFASLFLLIRVLTKNCYITVAIGLFISVFFDSFSMGIKGGSTHIGWSLVDPYLSAYFMGDTVPRMYAEQFKDLKYMSHAYTVNRVGFLVVAIILLVSSYFILRKEKLHEGFGE
jgi:hypothetical protein